MPIMEIYRNGRKLEDKEFRSSFYILKDLTNHICWTADGEEGGNEILIWIQSSYRILHVRPDWQLTIDGVTFPQKFYMGVELKGKHVHLQYDEYEFVCQFPEAV